MSLSVTENWDGVTAPAIPSGWNVSNAAVVTSTTQKYSGTNSLALSGPSASTNYYCTYGTGDGSGSTNTTITMSAKVGIFSGFVPPGTYRTGISFRGSAATLDNSSTSTYVAFLESGGGGGSQTFRLGKIVSGTFTPLTDVTISGASVLNAWYAIALSFTGGGAFSNSISLTLQRTSDSYWLTSSGSFQSGAATAITSSNNDITTGAYSGCYSMSSPADVYLDDFSLSSSASATPQPTPWHLFSISR